MLSKSRLKASILSLTMLASSLFSAVPQDNAEALLARGNGLVEKGDLDGAIAAFREAIRKEPGNADAHYGLGKVLFAKGNFDEAIIAFREVVRLVPTLAVPHIGLGLVLEKKGDLDGAIAAFREASRLEPNLPGAHYALARALGMKGDLNGAIAAAREELRLQPENANAHYLLGTVLLALGNTEDASREFAEAQSLDPKLHPPASMAASAQVSGPDGGERFYTNDRLGIKILLPDEWQLMSEIKGPPNQPLIVTLGRPGVLAQVTLTREVLEATPEIYKNLLKRNFSLLGEDYRELGEEKVTQGELEGSKIAFSIKANNVTNRIWLLIFSKGSQHYWISSAAPDEYFERYQSTFQEMFDSVEFTGPADKAPSVTKEAIGPSRIYSGTTGQIAYSPATEVVRLREWVAQNPDDHEAHMELGNALDDSGDTDAAIAEYKVAIGLNPHYPLAHGNLGASYIRKEDWKSADAELREAIRLAPDYFMAHFRLAYVLAHRDNPQGAFDEFRQTIRIDREQALALMFQEFPGLVQLAGAQQEIASAPTEAVARLYIALQLIRLKKPCRSWIHQLDEAFRIAPRFAFAEQLRKEGRQQCK